MVRISSNSRAQVVRCEHLPEPLLKFGAGGRHIDQRAGIARYGPRSYGTTRHPSQVRVGIIGSAESIAAAAQWVADISAGVTGTDTQPSFPGCMSDRGFFTKLEIDDRWNEKLTQREIRALVKSRDLKRRRFDELVQLIDDRTRLLAERDQSPQYLLICLPDDIISKFRAITYKEGPVHVSRDLRRTLKANLMRYRIPTQLLRLATTDGRDSTPVARIAWNFFSGLYFKAGGLPWGPTGMQHGTCFVGISFFRPLGKPSVMRTSLAQAFDERGEGLVLRGHDFEWDPDREGTRSPHLSSDQAASLVKSVLQRYQREQKQTPARVVIHKKSRFWPKERAGFQEILDSQVSAYDLVALRRQRDVRLVTTSLYPPLRGTRVQIGDLDYLYTTGFIPELAEFHGMHVPSPIQLADHVGQDTPRRRLLEEVLVLTKMNSNSCNFAGSLPVTLEFSQLVGDILRAVPEGIDPLPQFKYYM